MSAETAADSPPDDEGQLRGVLIDNCRISPENVARISEFMVSSGRSFSDSALQLGLITPSELEDAQAWAHRESSRADAGLVEAAIRRISGSRGRMLSRIGHRVQPGKNLIILHEPYNPRSEKLRALRTELLLLADTAARAVTIALLSPLPGEGRSQLAAELAVSFAQLGRSTLLLDADMRRPCLHELFEGTDEKRGLAQAIATHDSPYVHGVEGFEHLHLISSGGVADNPLELLSDAHFKRLADDWNGRYDFVVIDTPAVSNYADGLAVATIARKSLVLSRAAYTPYSAVRELLRRLATTEAQVLGAVINHF